MSSLRTADRSTNTKVNRLGIRPSGSAISSFPAPTFIGMTAAQAGTTGALSLPWIFGVATGDIAILVHETTGNGGNLSISGWNAFAGSPVVDVASTAGSKLQVLWQRVASNAPASVSVPGATDHSVASLFIFRNARVSEDPGRAITTATKTVASPTISWPSINTVAHNSMVIYIASRPDDNASTTFFQFFDNPSLTGTALCGEAGTVNGNGGGYGVFRGVKADPGSTGAATANLSAVVTNAMMVLALEPSVALQS